MQELFIPICLIQNRTKMNSATNFYYITFPKLLVKFCCHYNKNLYLCLSKAEEKCGSLKLFLRKVNDQIILKQKTKSQ